MKSSVRQSPTANRKSNESSADKPPEVRDGLATDEAPPRNPERPHPGILMVLIVCLVFWIGVLVWLALRTNA